MIYDNNGISDLDRLLHLRMKQGGSTGLSDNEGYEYLSLYEKLKTNENIVKRLNHQIELYGNIVSEQSYLSQEVKKLMLHVLKSISENE